MRPDLHTITLGEQNSTIVNLIKSCFDKVKDHDFLGALTRPDGAVEYDAVDQPDEQLHDDPQP